MYVDYTFKVNSFSVEKSVLSVTYTPVDTALELQPFHIQQLGVERQLMVDYSTGAITLAQFQANMRIQIVNADGMPQEHWNATLIARQLIVPPEVEGMIGLEWSPVGEPESIGSAAQMETL